jgi:hypothetical protein
MSSGVGCRGSTGPARLPSSRSSSQERACEGRRGRVRRGMGPAAQPTPATAQAQASPQPLPRGSCLQAGCLDCRDGHLVSLSNPDHRLEGRCDPGKHCHVGVQLGGMHQRHVQLCRGGHSVAQHSTSWHSPSWHRTAWHSTTQGHYESTAWLSTAQHRARALRGRRAGRPAAAGRARGVVRVQGT